MPRTKVLVIGASGMLGSMILDVLSRDEDLKLFGTRFSRTPTFDVFPGARIFPFSHKPSPIPDLGLGPNDWIVNAAGCRTERSVHDVTTSCGGARDERDLAATTILNQAIDANVTLALKVAGIARKTGARLLQVGSELVFSGEKGGYKEDAPHDGTTVDAKTQSLGEVPGAAILRCALVGPEAGWSRKLGLLERFLAHPNVATVVGASNHYWNGVTTLEFARVVAGLIQHPDLLWEGVQHLVPADTESKANLLELIGEAFGREDLSVFRAESVGPGHHRLWTGNRALCGDLWEVAGRDSWPTIGMMVQALARWESRVFLRRLKVPAPSS